MPETGAIVVQPGSHARRVGWLEHEILRLAGKVQERGRAQAVASGAFKVEPSEVTFTDAVCTLLRQLSGGR